MNIRSVLFELFHVYTQMKGETYFNIRSTLSTNPYVLVYHWLLSVRF